jgi:hypothetical protein
MQGSEAFHFDSGSSISTVDLGINHRLTSQMTLFAGMEYGFAAPFEPAADGLVRGLGSISFSGYELGMRFNDLVADNDSLSLSLSQPIRVENASASMMIATGRTSGGAVIYDEVDLDLAPTGREIDLNLGYDITLGSSARARLAATYAFDAGHVAGQQQFAVAASLANNF